MEEEEEEKRNGRKDSLSPSLLFSVSAAPATPVSFFLEGSAEMARVAWQAAWKQPTSTRVREEALAESRGRGSR